MLAFTSRVFPIWNKTLNLAQELIKGFLGSETYFFFLRVNISKILEISKHIAAKFQPHMLIKLKKKIKHHCLRNLVSIHFPCNNRFAWLRGKHFGSRAAVRNGKNAVHIRGRKCSCSRPVGVCDFLVFLTLLLWPLRNSWLQGGSKNRFSCSTNTIPYHWDKGECSLAAEWINNTVLIIYLKLGSGTSELGGHWGFFPPEKSFWYSFYLIFLFQLWWKVKLGKCVK